MFQLTAARRRLHPRYSRSARHGCFNSQPLEGGCLRETEPLGHIHVSTHSRSKAAAGAQYGSLRNFAVSTHSRSKAAATVSLKGGVMKSCFNSQPLEGGCV